MTQEIRTIRLWLPMHISRVNCYLIKTDSDFILIDTGSSNQRGELEQELEAAGCRPGNLRVIVITHGDFDHTGNAAYLRQKFGTPIAMHKGDLGMADHGDMFWNRKSGNVIIRKLAPIFMKFPQADWFTPDVLVEDGLRLSDYGCEGRVLSIPGHSLGSIGILTDDGSLFCGDLLDNTDKPRFNTIMDDPTTARASVDRLKELAVKMVYPGHGAPFALEMIK